MRRVLCASVLCLLALTAGCSKPTDPWSEEYIKYDLENNGPADIKKMIAAAQYTPPADGRVTREQMQAALKALELGVKVRLVTVDSFHENVGSAAGAPLVGNFAAGLTTVVAARNVDLANVRAAISLGMNPAEYMWIEQQLSTAMRAQSDSSGQWGLRQLKEKHARTESLVEKANIHNQIVDMERRMKQRQRDTLPKGTVENMKLLTEFKPDLDRIEHLSKAIR